MDVMMPEDGWVRDDQGNFERWDEFKALPSSPLTAKAMKGDREKCIAQAHRTTSPSRRYRTSCCHCCGCGCTGSAVPSSGAEPDRQSFKPDLERVEIELLLEGIFRHYGFDFRAYAYASIAAPAVGSVFRKKDCRP